MIGQQTGWTYHTILDSFVCLPWLLSQGDLLPSMWVLHLSHLSKLMCHIRGNQNWWCMLATFYLFSLFLMGNYRSDSWMKDKIPPMRLSRRLVLKPSALKLYSALVEKSHIIEDLRFIERSFTSLQIWLAYIKQRPLVVNFVDDGCIAEKVPLVPLFVTCTRPCFFVPSTNWYIFHCFILVVDLSE